MENQKEVIEHLPLSSGVYIFKNSDNKILYIGKAININRRVKSYFQAETGRPAKTQALVNQIAHIETISTASEFDAIILEANLIRKHAPKYNSIAKDDKSPLYIKITLSESLPHVTFIRKTQALELHTKDISIGPFQSSKTARKLMSTLRHAIPFCLQKIRNGKPCFYTHIGLCNPCPSTMVHIQNPIIKKNQIQLYRSNIFRLARILQGKSKEVLDSLNRQMNAAAEKNMFEQAQIIKKQLESLTSIYTRHHDPMAYDHITKSSMFKSELKMLQTVLASYFPEIAELKRVECIDVSHLGGSFTTGSLVVLELGIPNTSEYRRFKIRSVKGPNDVASIREVLERRLGHPEWNMPDLFIIDGGKPQVQSAAQALHEHEVNIPVIGLAKRNEEIIVQTEKGFKTLRLALNNPALHVIQSIRDEAHRFAKSYHSLLRRTLKQIKSSV